jgi:colanic acid biosynthesis glycosyl transferase WcaI
MRILLIIIQFPPDVNSTGMLMADLCEGLIGEGHELSVITALPHYEGFQIRKEYRGRLFQRERYRGMDVLRLRVYAPGKKSMANRLASYLSFAVLAALAGVFWGKSWDLILCTNGAFFTGVSSWLIGALRGQLRNRAAIETLKRIEGFMYRKAGHITVISTAMRRNLMQKGLPREKVTLVPNFVNTGFIRPLPRANPFSAAQGLDGKFVVMHAGNLGYVYDLDSLLEAAALIGHEKDIFFLIVGGGVARGGLEEKADRLELQNVRFLPFLPHESLPWLRASADVQVSLYKPGAARYSMPSKIYEIMASGRPLLAGADPGSDVWELIERSRCGICVKPEEPRQLANAILDLYRDRPLRETMGRNGREWAEKKYCREVVVRSYHRLIQEISGRRIGNSELEMANGSGGYEGSGVRSRKSEIRDRKSEIRD